MKQMFTKWLLIVLLFSGTIGTTWVSAQVFEEVTFSSGEFTSHPAIPVTGTWYEQLRLDANRNRWEFKSGAAYLKKENNGYAGMVEAWLVTREITLLAGSNILTFDEKQAGTADNGASFSVRISLSSQEDMDGFTTIESYAETDFTTAFTTHIIDLSDYAGQTVHIAFVRGLISEMGDDWYIDNVAVKGSDVVEVNDFTITNITDDQIDLDWILNSSNDSVLVAWSSNGVFGAPVDLTTYAAGDPIAGGGTVLYYGDILTTYSHMTLDEFTPYYYKIWSVNGEMTYSYAGVTKNATTIGNTTIEYTDFEAGVNGWSLDANVRWPNDDWYRGATRSIGVVTALLLSQDQVR